MRVINHKSALYMALGIVAASFLFRWFIGEQQWSFSYIIESVTTSVTATTFIYGLFRKWLWKMKIFRKWLVIIPNLNGRWKGELRSSWINKETNEKYYTEDVEFSIKQSLTHISCVMKTPQMKSSSMIAQIVIDEENQKYQLVYSYQSEPNQNLQKESRIHFGTAKLDMNDQYDVSELQGLYWTNRETDGVLHLERID